MKVINDINKIQKQGYGKSWFAVMISTQHLLVQGKNLTAACRAMSVTFTAASEKLARAEYDAFDLNSQASKQDASEFRTLSNELDRRLAAIILQVWTSVDQKIWWLVKLSFCQVLNNWIFQSRQQFSACEMRCYPTLFICSVTLDADM